MTTMRNAIGSMELDECFQNRDLINGSILTAMTEATAPWGVQVTRYEIKDITPPQSIKEDMEKQMTAEREKRSVILTDRSHHKSRRRKTSPSIIGGSRKSTTGPASRSGKRTANPRGNR